MDRKQYITDMKAHAFILATWSFAFVNVVPMGLRKTLRCVTHPLALVSLSHADATNLHHIVTARWDCD
jgi:hypothetical protein